MFRAATLFIALGSLFGCHPSGAVYSHAPAKPYLARYGGGIYFQSTDGFKVYDKVAIVPGRLTKDCAIVLPDGATVKPSDLSPETLKNHGFDLRISDDDGMGNFFLLAHPIGLTVFFDAHRAEYITLSSQDRTSKSPFSLRFADQTVPISVEHAELVKLIGSPDEMISHQFPPDR